MRCVCSRSLVASQERLQDVSVFVFVQFERFFVVTIRLFGMTKSLAGNLESLSLVLNNRTQVKDLVGLLDAGYPAIGELIHKKKVLVSVNQEIAHEQTEIRDGDEVALLPPFAGGAPMDHASDDAQFVRVQREDFSVDAEINRVRGRSKRLSRLSVRTCDRGELVVGASAQQHGVTGHEQLDLDLLVSSQTTYGGSADRKTASD